MNKYYKKCNVNIELMWNWLVSYKKKKKGNLFTRVKCHSTPLDTCMLTICSSLDIKGNFSSINEKKYTEYTDGLVSGSKTEK